MGAALGWGALAASSLVFGALRATRGLATAAGRHRPRVRRGGAHQRNELRPRRGGRGHGEPGTVGLGLAVGALTYHGLNRVVERRTSHGAAGAQRENAGPALALGAFLDDIPEQTVLGIGLATGEGISLALLVALLVSNLP